MLDRYDVVSDRDVREAMTKTQDYLSTLPEKRTVVPLQQVQ